MVEIHVLRGSHEVKNDDWERAVAAADAVFTLNKTTSDACGAAFYAWWCSTEDQNYDSATGLAAIWVQAERAANTALTLGWARPDGALCALIA